MRGLHDGVVVDYQDWSLYCLNKDIDCKRRHFFLYLPLLGVLGVHCKISCDLNYKDDIAYKKEFGYFLTFPFTFSPFHWQLDMLQLHGCIFQSSMSGMALRAICLTYTEFLGMHSKDQRGFHRRIISEVRNEGPKVKKVNKRTTLQLFNLLG